MYIVRFRYRQAQNTFSPVNAKIQTFLEGGGVKNQKQPYIFLQKNIIKNFYESRFRKN